MRIHVLDMNVDTLCRAPRIRSVRLLRCRAEHDHTIAETHLRMRDAAVWRVMDRVPLEAEYLLEPRDRLPCIGKTQNRHHIGFVVGLGCHRIAPLLAFKLAAL